MAAPQDLRTPAAPAVEGGYQLGRGEARSGRTTDALLAAYRIGARVSWREMSTTAVRNGIDGEVLADFAELVFAYIDELSAAAVAGHTDETETTGRVRQRLLERIAALLLDGSTDEEVTDAAESAGWTPPTTLTAVIVPESQVRPVLGLVAAGTIQAAETPELDDAALLLVPERARPAASGAAAAPSRDRGSHRRAGRPVAGGTRVVRPRAPGPRARDRARHRGRAAPAGAARGRGRARRPARPRPGPARGAPARHRREARRHPARLAAATRAAARRSPPRCSCTRRPSATGWASSATSTATSLDDPDTVLALTLALA